MLIRTCRITVASSSLADETGHVQTEQLLCEAGVKWNLRVNCSSGATALRLIEES